MVTERFSGLLDLAVAGILDDPDWWSSLAWPWPAIELARQEPPHPGGRASLYGRFDCLLDPHGTWQVIEYNADTPSGGREAMGLEPGVARLNLALRRISRCWQRPAWYTGALRENRCNTGPTAVRLMGDRLVAQLDRGHGSGDMAHGWLFPLWAPAILVLVGDVTDLAHRGGQITLRGQPIDALYRFYPIERLYRHAVFASLCDAAISGKVLMLNGLRGFLAQSKACLAWLWTNRARLGASARGVLERHLPPTLLARDPAAADLRWMGVVKHVNGREGDSVVFGKTLDDTAWEARLIEPGYVVQQTVHSARASRRPARRRRARVLQVVSNRVRLRRRLRHRRQIRALLHTRLDGPITSGRATYAATLQEPASSSPAVGATRRQRVKQGQPGRPCSSIKYVSWPPR